MHISCSKDSFEQPQWEKSCFFRHQVSHSCPSPAAKVAGIRRRSHPTHKVGRTCLKPQFIQFTSPSRLNKNLTSVSAQNCVMMKSKSTLDPDRWKDSMSSSVTPRPQCPQPRPSESSNTARSTDEGMTAEVDKATKVNLGIPSEHEPRAEADYDEVHGTEDYPPCLYPQYLPVWENPQAK